MLQAVPFDMAAHMKTAIDLGDSPIAEAKRVAAQQNTTLRALVEAGLREVLGQLRQRAAPFRLRRAKAKGRGLRPELQGASWQQLRDQACGDPPA